VIKRPGFVLLLVAISGAAPVSAQRDGGRAGPRPERAELEQRMRAQMGRMVQEQLGLTDAQLSQLETLSQRFDARRRDLAEREFETRRRVEQIANGADASQDEARALLTRVSDLRLEEARLFGEEQAAFLEVLTPKQAIGLQELREDLGRRIRTLRGGERGDGPERRRRPDGRIGAQFRGPSPWPL